MFRLRNTNDAGQRDDRGMAVVAAIGVAFILMVILTIVVAVTVVTTNSSGRDRVRTASIHSAEGALDSAMAEMERSTPCGALSWSPLVVGEGTQETIVTVEIEYYPDDSFGTPILCSSGSLAEDAAYATITATAVPTHAVAGVQPSRTIEARLAVTSRGEVAVVPGLYARYDMWLVGTADVFSPSASSAPDIWVDSGKFYCRPTMDKLSEIEADVVVGQGDAELQEWCWFKRDVFIGRDMFWRDSTVINGTEWPQCNDKFYCGDLTVGRTLNIQGSPAERLTAGANVTVGTSITGDTSRLVANGAVTVPATIEAKDPRGFPTVEYVESNWTGAPYNMVASDLAEFESHLDWKSYQQCTGWGWHRVCTTKWYDHTNVANCNFDSQYYNSTIHLSSTPRVYDLRDCAGGGTRDVNDVMKFLSTNTIEVNADTAFIVSGFHNSGTLNFVSGPGAASSRVWIIVSDEGVPTYTPPGSGVMPSCSSATLYNLCSTNILASTANTPIMWYTKHLFYSDGKDASVNDMYGQVFAGTIVFKGYLDLQFETLPIPHEILWDAGEDGLDVQLLSKRELPTE